MLRTLLFISLLTLTGCLAVCPDSHDREAKERLFSLEEPSVLEQHASERIDASGLSTDPETRRRILWMSAEETSARLGSYTAETHVLFTWKRAENEISLSETAILEHSDTGDFRVSINNDRDFGMELRWIDEVPYVKSRQGVYRERRADRAGHEEWREESLSQIRTLLELADGRVQFGGTGSGTHEKRPVIRYALSQSNEPDPSSSPPERPHWARDPVFPSDGPDKSLKLRLAPYKYGEPVRIIGEIHVDDLTGTILHADIDAVINVSPGPDEGGPPARLEMKIQRNLSRIGKNHIIDIPEHRPFERRPRAIKDPLDWWPPYVSEKEKAEADSE